MAATPVGAPFQAILSVATDTTDTTDTTPRTLGRISTTPITYQCDPVLRDTKFSGRLESVRQVRRLQQQEFGARGVTSPGPAHALPSVTQSCVHKDAVQEVGNCVYSRRAREKTARRSLACSLRLPATRHGPGSCDRCVSGMHCAPGCASESADAVQRLLTAASSPPWREYAGGGFREATVRASAPLTFAFQTHPVHRGQRPLWHAAACRAALPRSPRRGLSLRRHFSRRTLLHRDPSTDDGEAP